ncbi:putative 60S ribosomal protein, partial [Naja naja]
MDAANF